MYARRLVRFATAASGVVALLAVLSAPASAAETKPFTAQKSCYVPVVSVAPPAPGGYCLITGSSLRILKNAKAYYTAATVVQGVLSSPVTIRTNHDDGSTAIGQCIYHLQTPTTPGYGLCVYSSGTGELAGIHLTYAVGPPIGGQRVYALTGSFWFEENEDD
jgi:opacity protein-like surface antigen